LGNRSGALSIAPLIDSKSTALLWMSVIRVTSAVAAIHAVEAPANKALLAGLSKQVGPPRGCRRIRKESHDSCHNSDGAVERPHSSEFAQIGNPGSLNCFPPVLLRAARQKGISPNPLDNRYSGDMP